MAAIADATNELVLMKRNHPKLQGERGRAGMAIRWGVVSKVTVLAIVATMSSASAETALAVGNSACSQTGHFQRGEVTSSSFFVIGSRSTIEGQNNVLCNQSGPIAKSGSFQWAALENTTPAWSDGSNIIQVGYGRCRGTNNGPPVGINCDGNNYYYWAWGSWCGAAHDGSLAGQGPLPLRIGPAQSTTMPTKDYYVLYEVVNGVAYYDGYVGGVLLQGLDANGVNRVARVPASSVCWDQVSGNRKLAWFGETFNNGDSMGGWTSTTRNHLDYTSMQYSYAQGWKATNLPFVTTCNAGQISSIYACNVVAADHMFIDTN